MARSVGLDWTGPRGLVEMEMGMEIMGRGRGMGMAMLTLVQRAQTEFCSAGEDRQYW